LLAEDRREMMCLFRVGRFGNAPGPAESLGVEKTQRRSDFNNLVPSLTF
jgi:hypothetical protein